MECCYTPYVTCHICIPTLAISGYVICFSLRCWVWSFVLYFVMSCIFISCHHVHCICIRVRLMHSRFSPLSVLHSGAPMSPGVPFYLFSCAGVKHSQNGPRFAKRPWYSTDRPPVKFCAIWRSFDTPTVNRATDKSICVLQQNSLSKQHKTHQTLFHALVRSITIVWAKTIPHLEPPSSLYLFICETPEKSRRSNPRPAPSPPPDTSGRSRTRPPPPRANGHAPRGPARVPAAEARRARGRPPSPLLMHFTL